MQNRINVHEFDTQLKYVPQKTFTVDQKKELFKKFKSEMVDLNVEQQCIS